MKPTATIFGLLLFGLVATTARGQSAEDTRIYVGGSLSGLGLLFGEVDTQFFTGISYHGIGGELEWSSTSGGESEYAKKEMIGNLNLRLDPFTMMFGGPLPITAYGKVGYGLRSTTYFNVEDSTDSLKVKTWGQTTAIGMEWGRGFVRYHVEASTFAPRRIETQEYDPGSQSGDLAADSGDYKVEQDLHRESFSVQFGVTLNF